MRLRSFLVVPTLILCWSAFSRADVLKVVVDDTIQAATAERIERAIDRATADQDTAVLIELNTPGGAGDAMQQIMQKIIASRVPVIIYVTPSGGRAASAGFFILESADIAAMAPGTNAGAAHPVGPFGGDIPGVMGDKVLNDVSALMRSVVSKRRRNVEVAESAVRQSKSFTDSEALSQNLIDYVAANEQDLFRQISAHPVKRFNGETITLTLVGQKEVVMGETLKERILAFLMEPDVAFVLLAIGALALYAEFNHPGAVWPGTVGDRFYPAGNLCPSPASHPVRRRGIDLCLLCTVCAGCEVWDARSVGRGRYRNPGARSIAPHRHAHSGNARPSGDGAGGCDSARRDHGVSDVGGATRAPEQGADRHRGAGRGDRDGANRAGTGRQGLRARRDLGCGGIGGGADGRTGGSRGRRWTAVAGGAGASERSK